MSDEFVKQSLVLSPTSASQAGYHKYTEKESGKTADLDSLLDDMSKASMDSQRRFFANWRARFHKEILLSSLSPEDAADWQLIDDQIGQQLLELNEIHNYEHNPTVAVELIGTALFQPLTEDYAPKQTRLEHIISRIEQIPHLLSDVKVYLNNADPLYIKTAVEENDGNIDLIENTIAKEVSATDKNGQLKTSFDKVSPTAIAALKDYSKWLQDTLSKQPSNRDWRLGKQLYDKKFRFVLQVDLTPEQVLSDAERDLKAVRAEMLSIAEPMHKRLYPERNAYPNKTGTERENLIISEVLSNISDDHCKPEQLLPTIETDLANIKQFVRDKRIVSLGSRENLKVIPTPPFERGVLSVAAFHSAPPLNPQAEAEYWVTPIDPETPKEKVESKLREYNNFTLQWLTIHEAMPGHYVQFEHLNNLEPERRRLLRSLYGNGAYCEGWAEYVAQVMMDEGFLDNDQRFRLIMRKIRLRVLANAILDIKMHTMNMTDDQAMTLMTKEAFQTQAEAEGKLKRAKLTSTQLPTYYVGTREWLDFRKRYQAKAGSAFDMLTFHNEALDEGPLPVPVVENLLTKRLGTNSPVQGQRN